MPVSFGFACRCRFARLCWLLVLLSASLAAAGSPAFAGCFAAFGFACRCRFARLCWLLALLSASLAVAGSPASAGCLRCFRLRLPLLVRPPMLVACAAFGFACRCRFARLCWLLVLLSASLAAAGSPASAGCLRCFRLRLPLSVRPPLPAACAAFGFACRFRFARLLLSMASSAALEHCAPQRYQRCTDHHGPHAHWHAYQYQQYAQSNQRSRQQSYWRAPRWTARPRAHPREYRSGRAPPRMRRISAGRARTFARWPAAPAVRPVCTRIAAHSGVTSGRTRAARRTPMHDRL